MHDAVAVDDGDGTRKKSRVEKERIAVPLAFRQQIIRLYEGLGNHLHPFEPEFFQDGIHGVVKVVRSEIIAQRPFQRGGGDAVQIGSVEILPVVAEREIHVRTADEMPRSEDFGKSAFVQRVDLLRGDLAAGGKGNGMPFRMHLRKRRGHADTDLPDRPFVALPHGSDGGYDRAAERSHVEKSFRRIAFIFFASAAEKDKGAVYPSRSDEKGDFVRPYVQNGNAFVSHDLRPLRKKQNS